MMATIPSFDFLCKVSGGDRKDGKFVFANSSGDIYIFSAALCREMYHFKIQSHRLQSILYCKFQNCLVTIESDKNETRFIGVYYLDNDEESGNFLTKLEEKCKKTQPPYVLAACDKSGIFVTSLKSTVRVWEINEKRDHLSTLLTITLPLGEENIEREPTNIVRFQPESPSLQHVCIDAPSGLLLCATKYEMFLYQIDFLAHHFHKLNTVILKRNNKAPWAPWLMEKFDDSKFKSKRNEADVSSHADHYFVSSKHEIENTDFGNIEFGWEDQNDARITEIVDSRKLLHMKELSCTSSLDQLTVVTSSRSSKYFFSPVTKIVPPPKNDCKDKVHLNLLLYRRSGRSKPYIDLQFIISPVFDTCTILLSTEKESFILSDEYFSQKKQFFQNFHETKITHLHSLLSLSYNCSKTFLYVLTTHSMNIWTFPHRAVQSSQSHLLFKIANSVCNLSGKSKSPLLLSSHCQDISMPSKLMITTDNYIITVRQQERKVESSKLQNKEDGDVPLHPLQISAIIKRKKVSDDKKNERKTWIQISQPESSTNICKRCMQNIIENDEVSENERFILCRLFLIVTQLEYQMHYYQLNVDNDNEKDGIKHLRRSMASHLASSLLQTKPYNHLEAAELLAFSSYSPEQSLDLLNKATALEKGSNNVGFFSDPITLYILRSFHMENTKSTLQFSQKLWNPNSLLFILAHFIRKIKDNEKHRDVVAILTWILIVPTLPWTSESVNDAFSLLLLLEEKQSFRLEFNDDLVSLTKCILYLRKEKDNKTDDSNKKNARNLIDYFFRERKIAFLKIISTVPSILFESSKFDEKIFSMKFSDEVNNEKVMEKISKKIGIVIENFESTNSPSKFSYLLFSYSPMFMIEILLSIRFETNLLKIYALLVSLVKKKNEPTLNNPRKPKLLNSHVHNFLSKLIQEMKNKNVMLRDCFQLELIRHYLYLYISSTKVMGDKNDRKSRVKLFSKNVPSFLFRQQDDDDGNKVSLLVKTSVENLYNEILNSNDRIAQFVLDMIECEEDSRGAQLPFAWSLRVMCFAALGIIDETVDGNLKNIEKVSIEAMIFLIEVNFNYLSRNQNVTMMEQHLRLIVQVILQHERIAFNKGKDEELWVERAQKRRKFVVSILDRVARKYPEIFVKIVPKHGNLEFFLPFLCTAMRLKNLRK
eukprot:g2492.t1